MNHLGQGPYKWNLSFLNIHGLNDEQSNAFKFVVLADVFQDSRIISAPQFTITTGSSDVVLDSGAKTATILFHISELAPALVKTDIDPTLIIEKIQDELSAIQLTSDEALALKMKLEELAGDPTKLTGSYLRMLYFSSIVITTVGFGDIVPISILSRSSVAIEAVVGVILAGLFLNAIAYRAGQSKTEAII